VLVMMLNHLPPLPSLVLLVLLEVVLLVGSVTPVAG